ncbi:MAG: MFS transporter [Gammaproteobacteria bacterium]|nr:MFS transporter [Gammaproteobacteria bacterium]
MKRLPVPFIRLSGYYFFHFATLGLLMPFWGPYLRELGIDEKGIGLVYATLLGAKIIAPNVWGWLGDHFGRRLPLIRGGALGALLVFAFLGNQPTFAMILLVMAGFGFFWNAILPQFEATTLNHLGRDHSRYTLIRVWGSAGFIAAVLGGGWWFDSHAIEQLPTLVMILLVGLLLSTLLTPEPAGSTRPGPGEKARLWPVLKQPRVLALFVVFFLMQASHGPYYSLFSIYLEDLGYSRSQVGQFWALGVFAEIGVFLLMPWLLRRFSLKGLLLCALLVTTGRWLMIGLIADKMWALLLAQSLHLASFGIYHGVAVVFIHRLFTGSLQGRGQALYSSLGFGAGGAVGSVMAGYIWSSVSPAAVFLAAAAATGLAALLAMLGVVEPRASAPAESSANEFT